MAKGRAEIEITASTSRLAAGLNAARAKIQSWASSTARGVGSAFSGAGKAFAKALPRAGGSIANFGGDLLTKGFDQLVDIAGGVRDFERNLVRLQIATNQTPEQMDAMRESIRSLSKETGVSSAEILVATSNYVDLTGDVAGANVAMRTFARTAQASGASMSDVSGAAAAMGDALKISPEDLEATFSGLINQGKAGAVTLKDFAAELSALAPKFARFKGATGREGALQLGAAFQVARKGFGSASEAATGLEAMMGALANNAAKFQAQGVKIFDVHKDGTKTFRNLHDIIGDIGKSKLAKDPTLLNKAFGSKEAEATFNQLNRLAPLYDEIVAAGQDRMVVERDLATFQQSSAGKLDATINSLKENVAEAFTPERIEMFVDVIQEVASAIGTVIEGLGEIKDHLTGKTKEKRNPFTVDESNRIPVDDERTSAVEKAQFAIPSMLFGKEATKKAYDVYANVRGGTLTDQPDAVAENAAKARFYDDAMTEIEGAGSRTKRTRAAVRATMVTGEAAVGSATAGTSWLLAEGVKDKDIQRIRDELAAENVQKTAEYKSLIQMGVDKIAAAVAKGQDTPTVDLDGKQISRNVKQNPDARGRKM